jgi:hypothetical protein
MNINRFRTLTAKALETFLIRLRPTTDGSELYGGEIGCDYTGNKILLKNLDTGEVVNPVGADIIRRQLTLSEDTDTLPLPQVYNPDIDTCLLFIGGIYHELGDDFTIDVNSRTIVKTHGVWNEGYTANLLIFRHAKDIRNEPM